MTSLLDPVELGALARRVDGWADELRGRASGLLVCRFGHAMAIHRGGGVPTPGQ